MTIRSAVPCGTCHACCKAGHLVILLPHEGDDLTAYQYELKLLRPDMPLAPVLKHKPNGDCVYLGEAGCTIHDRSPAVCRTFDCRRWFLMHSRIERRMMMKRGSADREVIEAGRDRLPSLQEGATSMTIPAESAERRAKGR